MTGYHRPAALRAVSHARSTTGGPQGMNGALRDMRGGVGHGRHALALTRRYDVCGFAPSGETVEFTRVAPATPMFEDAFGAFARGTLIATSKGPMAVEDLLPGTLIQTVDAGLLPLQWIGAITHFPDQPDSLSHGRADGRMLTRLSADAFGFGRPTPDLVLGPRARILYRSTACREVIGADAAFAPAHAFTDGDGVIALRPVSPVRLYHLALEGQHAILANGMEVESFHPGAQPDAMAPVDTMDLFLSLFPHVSGPGDFGEVAIPRLTAFELEHLRAA